MIRVLTILIAALCGWLCITAAPARPEVGATADQNPIARKFPRWLGVSSCSASACHGNPDAKDGKRGEHTTWIEHDAHARAYNVLFDERSVRIARNLKLEKPAHESDTCLVCHASSPPNAQRDERFQLSDGVSCESCHGPAEKWLREHYLPGWKTRSHADKTALGFQPTKNLLARARACVVCHVGHGDADVNHDLLAAGHPRLLFEYSSFLAAIPKHWSEEEERRRYPNFDTHAWMIGQVTVAQASMDLLAQRTRRIWPELAEYDCRACHHDLTGQTARTRASDKTALLRWNDWHAVFLPSALQLGTGKDVGALSNSLVEIRAEMQKPMPKADQVRILVDRANEAVQRASEPLERKHTLALGDLQRLIRDLRVDSGLASRSAESLYQQKLALQALYQSLIESGSAEPLPSWRPAFDPADLPAGIYQPKTKWQPRH